MKPGDDDVESDTIGLIQIPAVSAAWSLQVFFSQTCVADRMI